MPTYTVQAAAKKKDIPDAKFGPAQVIALTLTNGSGEPILAEWFTKASTAIPQPGSSIEGDITPGQFGNDFKKASSGGYGAGGGGPRTDDPVTRRSIQMQHAQKAAVDALRLACEKGDYVPPTAADVADHVKRIAQALYEQVQEVAEKSA